MDYYSRYVELAKLNSVTSADIILDLKSVFARDGIPEYLVSDNGPQYASKAFPAVSKEYGFQHMTSSPYYAQANGLAEKTIDTVKSALLKSSDPYLGLLSYRSTPLELGYSPAQLLMFSNFRTTVAVITGQLKPSVIDCQRFRDKGENNKKKQKRNFDSHHSVQELPILNAGSQVWNLDLQTKGTVQKDVLTRSYTENT